MRSFLLIASAATALGGCAATMDPAPAPITPLSRYALRVEPGLDRIALAVHETGLSANQHSALQDLAARYAASGAPVVRVETPSGNDEAANRQAHAVRDALAAFGVPSERLMMVGYSAVDPRAPILAGFDTLRPLVPNCATEPRAMEGRVSNQSSLGLGCAVTANMAAQISNPRDILGPQPSSPPDSGRSAVIFENYRQGELTSAPQETLVQGRIAQAVE